MNEIAQAVRRSDIPLRVVHLPLSDKREKAPYLVISKDPLESVRLDSAEGDIDRLKRYLGAVWEVFLVWKVDEWVRFGPQEYILRSARLFLEGHGPLVAGFFFAVRHFESPLQECYHHRIRLQQAQSQVIYPESQVHRNQSFPLSVIAVPSGSAAIYFVVAVGSYSSNHSSYLCARPVEMEPASEDILAGFVAAAGGRQSSCPVYE